VDGFPGIKRLAWQGSRGEILCIIFFVKWYERSQLYNNHYNENLLIYCTASLIWRSISGVISVERAGSAAAPRSPFRAISSRSDCITAISRTCDAIISSASSRTRGSLMLALRELLMAIEWWGIIDFMKVTSPISAWVLFTESKIKPSAVAKPRTAILIPTPWYIDHIKESITTVITHPITNEAISRFTLNIA